MISPAQLKKLQERAEELWIQVDTYCDKVLDNPSDYCIWEKYAVERYLRDMYESDNERMYLDELKAAQAVGFMEALRHSKGKWAGRRFIMSDWQIFATWNIFGWQIVDEEDAHIRRFKTVYLEVPRKNGKTTWIAAAGLYLAFGEDEPGAEVYSCATKRDQAIISHSEATRMVKASEGLKKRVKIFKNNLSQADKDCKFEPLGANADSLDGLNVHGALVDELHAHKTRDLWDVMETATGSRQQPLQWAITTAGFDKHSICFQMHVYLERILKGAMDDNTFFGMIFTMDAEDDWEDEKTWRKANPNYGISVKPEDFRIKYKRAKEMPSQLNAFLRLKLDVWTESETLWLPIEHWKQCGKYEIHPEDLIGRECYAGMDLSSTTDVSALVYVFPPDEDGDPYILMCKFFIPEDNMHDRVNRDRVPYDVWVREGLVIATPGNVIDYNFIMHEIEQDIEKYYIKELAFDRWGSGKIIQDLQEMGFEDEDTKRFQERALIKFGQGFLSMAHPTREFEKLVRGHEIAHGNNKVLTWMASNVVIKHDPAGNMKPDKSKSIEKIDGIVASLMGIDRAIKSQEITTGLTII
jgi:phage terminase large subunit-like protein